MDLPFAGGPPATHGLLRVRAEDFVVEELAAFEPDGEGEHALLYVEKRDANTAWVARRLAAFAAVAAGAVGYAGRKDRHAVTRQWFSVALGGAAEPPWEELRAEGVRVLHATRHRRKLRRGALRGNRFALRVRRLAGDMQALDDRLRQAGERGVPNYFGEQRFGRGGANVDRAAAWLGGGPRPRGRDQRSLLLSVARSCIFNELLARRVDGGSWNRLLDGEVVNLDGSSSWFVAEAVDETLRRRAASFDVHPTGPLWGAGEPPAAGAVLGLERAAAARWPALQRGLAAQGVEQGRRPLRVRPRALAWSLADGELELAFELPAGAYATAVLREVVAWDQSSST